MSFPFRRIALAQSACDPHLPFLSKDGVFLCGTPLLECDARGDWRPRPLCDLTKDFARGPASRIDFASRMGAVARAFNDKDLGRASFALVHLEFPDLGEEGTGDLCKAGYNASEPRDDHNQKWVAANPDRLIDAAHKNGGYLWPKDVHPGNERNACRWCARRFRTCRIPAAGAKATRSRRRM